MNIKSWALFLVGITLMMMSGGADSIVWSLIYAVIGGFTIRIMVVIAVQEALTAKEDDRP